MVNITNQSKIKFLMLKRSFNIKLLHVEDNSQCPNNTLASDQDLVNSFVC